jgi:hypothetical protein
VDQADGAYGGDTTRRGFGARTWFGGGSLRDRIGLTGDSCGSAFLLAGGSAFRIDCSMLNAATTKMTLTMVMVAAAMHIVLSMQSGRPPRRLRDGRHEGAGDTLH